MLSPLFYECRPAAVSWLVIAVGINSINGMGRGRFSSHVCEKCLKACVPSFTDSNAATAPRRIVLVFKSIAAGFHPKPSFVFACSSAALLLAMLSDGKAALFDEILIRPQQSAALCLCTPTGSMLPCLSKIGPPTYSGVPALTQTAPVRPPVSGWVGRQFFQNGQAAYFFTCHID